MKTTGTLIGDELRKSANKFTGKKRSGLLKHGLKMIYSKQAHGDAMSK